MKKTVFSLLALTLCFHASNDLNSTAADANLTKDKNISKTDLNIQKQIAKEKKYKKEQKFYMGKEYNLTEKKIDPDSLKKIKIIEPDYDFEMLEF